MIRNRKLNQPPVRRIYKGDVPSIYDYDRDLVQKVLCQSHKRCFYFRSSKHEVNDYPTGPTPVRRKSSLDDQPPTTEKFPDNSITTARYTLWNFLPKNLFEQFRRLMNFYFLVGALIHTLIESPVHPLTAVAPLTFVILVTAIKQAYEDWLRHKNDDQVNYRAVRVVRNGKLMEIKSKDIQVGDIVKLDSNEQVPTDILLLGSSDEYLRCQINTANLDGETNLKLRYCPSGLPHFKQPEDFMHLHVIVECEHPCEDLYEYSGSLLIPVEKLAEMHWSRTESLANMDENIRKQERIESLKSSGVVRQGMTDFISIPLSMENMVLRGTRLKNTDFIYGIVIYTGRDTRLAINSENTQAKFSTVESAVNFYLIFFIGLLILMVIFCSAMRYCINWHPNGYPWFLEDDETESEASEVFQIVASFVILFNYIIPISLYVTIELQKFLGSKFFVWDNDMVDEEGKEPLCNTSDLNEELGQIDYLFSDKTGTLTKNIMKFRHCSIQGVRYEYKSDDKLYPLPPSFRSSKDDLNVPSVNVLETKDVLQFFRTLALCHSVQVVPKRKASFEMEPTSYMKIENIVEPKIALFNQRQSMASMAASEAFKFETTTINSAGAGTEYQASSPDEKALLESCDQLGVVYVGEREDEMTLNINGDFEKYKRLMHLEFDADRKCMSVIVENKAGEIWLYTKGAESSIIPKCDSGPSLETYKHVMDFALMGLRTLAVSERILSKAEYDAFVVELRAARRLVKNRQEKVRELYSNLESHMTLIGATGVEDQLQDQVPETLQSFAAAGIRVWMLTGDKLETGVNVAVSCGLITASTKQYIMSKSSDVTVIKEKLLQFKKEIDPNENTCFVIDGESLGVAFKECANVLRDVSMAATRVVCCRMAPLQKAQVVQMVKNSPLKPTCCAVGDGANDCAMILAAHIGIGILGKEGRQAARCADFALAKFGFMRKAILVHGHWYYVRLANLANYFFYKNVVFVFPQFFFSFHSNFSTQALFNGIFLMGFNIFFASCPVFYYGLTEQPYSIKELLNHPELYKHNHRNALMSPRVFSGWMISAFWHSIVCYFLTYLAWDNFDNISDLPFFGTIIFTGVLVTVNVKIFIETKYISWWYIASHMYSYATFFVITYIYSELELGMIWQGLSATDFHHVFRRMLTCFNFWLLLPLIIAVSILPDMTYDAVVLIKNEKSQIVKDEEPAQEHVKPDYQLSFRSLDKQE